MIFKGHEKVTLLDNYEIFPCSGMVRVNCWGGSPINGALPRPSHTFLPLGLRRRVMSKAQHAITVGHCTIHLGEWGALQAPQQFHGRVLVEIQGVRPLEAPKNLNLTVPKPGSDIAQQYVDGYAFFHVHCSIKSKENPKGPKFSILKFLIRKKCVCSIVLAG